MSFREAAKSPAVKLATALTIAMKFIGPAGKALGQLGKSRRARHLRQEITALHQFLTIVPDDVQVVVAHQLDKLHTRYKKMFPIMGEGSDDEPEILPVYPTLPGWRKPLLLYIPARKRALVPQFLFYGLIIVAFYYLSKSFSWNNCVVFSAFIVGFRDWAKRSEQPRNERTLFERVFLTYPSPPGTSNNFYRVMLVLGGALTIAATFASSPSEIAEGILGVSGVFLAFNDYLRSHDVKQSPSKPQPPEDSRAQTA